MKKTILDWFIKSSANPEEYSMSIKGLLLSNIALLMYVVHYFNANLTVDQVTELIGYFAGFLGSALFTAGMLRKMYLTLKKS